jgi:hypothetical protein
MEWILNTIELLALQQKSKSELIEMIKEVNEKNAALYEKYTNMYNSKRENNEKHEETLELFKKRTEDYVRQNVILEIKNKELSHKIDLKFGNTYNVNWTWVDKIVFVLKKADRPLRSSEIIEYLTKNDGAFRYWENPQKSLSAHLTKARKYGRIIGIRQKGQNGYLFKLPDLTDAKNHTIK